MLTLILKRYYKTVCYEDQLVFYIATVVYWNIVHIESCMYKSVLGKINITKKVFTCRKHSLSTEIRCSHAENIY
jgi:hypothetical protein